MKLPLLKKTEVVVFFLDFLIVRLNTNLSNYCN